MNFKELKLFTILFLWSSDSLFICFYSKLPESSYFYFTCKMWSYLLYLYIMQVGLHSWPEQLFLVLEEEPIIPFFYPSLQSQMTEVTKFCYLQGLEHDPLFNYIFISFRFSMASYTAQAWLL